MELATGGDEIELINRCLLAKEGTPVEYLEGDGDNTLIARLSQRQNIAMKTRFDRNHIVNNVGKNLYALHAHKGVKLSKSVILHIQKCLKYAFAKIKVKVRISKRILGH